MQHFQISSMFLIIFPPILLMICAQKIVPSLYQPVIKGLCEAGKPLLINDAPHSWLCAVICCLSGFSGLQVTIETALAMQHLKC